MGLLVASGNLATEEPDDRTQTLYNSLTCKFFHHKLLYILCTLIVHLLGADEFNREVVKQLVTAIHEESW
jgi:hypothetical protein